MTLYKPLQEVYITFRGLATELATFPISASKHGEALNHDIIATKQDVLNEIIWNNQNLLINKQSIYSKKIKEAGFLKLGDIVANGFKLKRWDTFREKNLSLSD